MVRTRSFDNLGRLDPAGATTSGYDNASNRTSVTTTAGTRSSTFDQRNRITATTGAGLPADSYVWTARGTLASATIGAQSTSYTFDAFERLTQVHKTGGYTVSHPHPHRREPGRRHHHHTRRAPRNAADHGEPPLLGCHPTRLGPRRQPPTRPQLLTPSAGIATVAATTCRLGEQPMYNLTVATTHTYYVLAGDTPVLVHNSGPDCGIPAGGHIGDELGGKPFHNSDYTLEEYVQFISGHTGDANPALGRPTMTEVETTLRNSGPTLLTGQNSSVFNYNGVRVIVNWDQPWLSTAFYTGR